MGVHDYTPVHSSKLLLEDPLGAVGGLVASLEDKLTLLCRSNVIIFSPIHVSSTKTDSIPGHVTKVHIKPRTELPLELDPWLLKDGTADPNELHKLFSDCSNRSVIFPRKELYRDAIQSRNGLRYAEWSPRGVDKFGRCVLSTVSFDGQGSIFSSTGSDNWDELVDISEAWHRYYIKHGRAALKYGKPVDERPQFDPAMQQNEALRNPLVCNRVLNYLDAVDDMILASTSWSTLPRKPHTQGPSKLNNQRPSLVLFTTPVTNRMQLTGDTKQTAPLLLIAILLKSGAVAIWDVRLPLVDMSSLALISVDYSFALSRKFRANETDKKRAIFLKLCDLDATHVMVVVVLTDGSVVGTIYELQYSYTGKFWMGLSHKISLCNTPVRQTPVLSCVWSMSDGVLCMGYGCRLLICRVKLVVREDTMRYSLSGTSTPTYQLFSSHLTKHADTFGIISGVCLSDNRVYMSTLDGALASLQLTGDQSSVDDWDIIWSTDRCDNPDSVQWEFHGVSVSTNGIYMTCIETPVNYLDNVKRFMLAVHKPKLRILSFWSNSKLIDFLFNSNLPLNRKVDALQQLSERWYHPDESQPKLVKELCLSRLGLSNFSNNTIPLVWNEQSLPSLQLYRFVLKLLTGEKDDHMKDWATNLLRDLDDLIRERHLERCFKLFIQSSIQRQAVDCLLVIRMALVVMDWCKQLTNTDCTLVGHDHSTFTPRLHLTSLPQLSRQVFVLARQLYQHRFQLPASDFPPNKATCPICSGECQPDLSSSNCANNHPIDRCMHTLEPCVDTTFRCCDYCNRIANAFPIPQDRLSVWRSSIANPMCIYCDLPLSLREL